MVKIKMNIFNKNINTKNATVKCIISSLEKNVQRLGTNKSERQREQSERREGKCRECMS